MVTSDLCYLADYQPELAGSHEKFFRVLDKIKESWIFKRRLFNVGVSGLFRARSAIWLFHL